MCNHNYIPRKTLTYKNPPGTLPFNSSEVVIEVIEFIYTKCGDIKR